MHVVFDIGNVIAEVKLEHFTAKLKEYILPEHDPMFFLENLQAMQDVGLSTVQKALHAHHDIKDPETVQLLLKAWNDTVIPNDMMLNFMDNLRNEGVKIALLSNMGLEHASYLRKISPRMFKNVVEHMSYEVGARKPSKLYYQSFLMDHDEFTGAVYLDDKDENLVVGKKYSFKSFKFDLDQVLLLPKSKQKLELDKVRSYIFDRKYDKIDE